MRVSTQILALALGFLIGVCGIAAAEKVKTNQSTKLYSRPGEQAKVLLSVKSGQNMTLLAQDGRWLKVRVQGRTGYVPRSKVDMADDGEIVRNTRRRPFVDGRSKKRGFGSDAPEDRIGADSLGEGADSGGGEDEEDEEEEPPKPKKKPAKVEDEEEEEEEEAPKPKKAAAKKVAAKASQEDEEEDEEEEDEDEPKKAKGGDEDDEDPIDDTKTAEPEEDTRVKARVGKKVSVFDEPNAESEESFVVRPGQILYPGEKDGEWTFVELDDGDGGWIETSSLELDSEGGGGMRKRSMDVRVRLGLMFIQQGMRTQGSNNKSVPDNYNIGTSSVTMSVGGGILVPYKAKYVLGGEVTYDYAKTLFGGVFYDPDGGTMPMPGVNTGLTVHNVNVRAIAGLDLRKKSGMTIFGRLGFRYQGFLVSDVIDATKNPAKIPSEVVKAPTLGAALAIPKLTEKIGLRFALDAILIGSSINQTKGLEDGGNPSAKAVVLGTAVNYRWKKSLDLQATYDLHYMGIDFGAPLSTSQRMHTGTNVSRTDFFHMVTFGIAKPF